MQESLSSAPLPSYTHPIAITLDAAIRQPSAISQNNYQLIAHLALA
jgi:hypothetical protein